MIIVIVIIISIVLLAGLILLFFLKQEEREFGVLAEAKIYQDSEEKPGQTMYASSIPLVGKPDYIIKKDNVLIPVEVKTGRTPTYPYNNHVMQLMAYCFLVEENYGAKPPGGYIRYPDKEFKMAYTEEAKIAVKKLVEEMVLYKKTNKEFNCNHPEHN